MTSLKGYLLDEILGSFALQCWDIALTFNVKKEEWCICYSFSITHKFFLFRGMLMPMMTSCLISITISISPWLTTLNFTILRQGAQSFSTPCLWPHRSVCLGISPYLILSSSGKYGWQTAAVLRSLSSFQQTEIGVISVIL